MVAPSFTGSIPLGFSVGDLSNAISVTKNLYEKARTITLSNVKTQKHDDFLRELHSNPKLSAEYQTTTMRHQEPVDSLWSRSGEYNHVVDSSRSALLASAAISADTYSSSPWDRGSYSPTPSLAEGPQEPTASLVKITQVPTPPLVEIRRTPAPSLAERRYSSSPSLLENTNEPTPSLRGKVDSGEDLNLVNFV